MKKQIVSVLAIVMSIVVTACGSTTSTATEETKSSVSAEESAKSAYDSLNSASEMVDVLMSSVLSAWWFSIDKGDDYILDYRTGIYDFAKDVGLDNTAASTAFNEVVEKTSYATLGERVYGQAFGEPAICVGVVNKYCENEGIFSQIDEHLSKAKEAIKAAESADANLSYAEDLRNYYTELQSYYEYAKSPSGSYKECSAQVETHRSNLKTYKNNLAFDLE